MKLKRPTAAQRREAIYGLAPIGIFVGILVACGIIVVAEVCVFNYVSPKRAMQMIAETPGIIFLCVFGTFYGGSVLGMLGLFFAWLGKRLWWLIVPVAGD